MRARLELVNRGNGLEVHQGGEVVSTAHDWRTFAGILRPSGAVVLVGLGLGGTARHVLELPGVARVVVVERLAELVALFRRRWPTAAGDPRLALVVGEFPQVLRLDAWRGWVIDDTGTRPRVVHAPAAQDPP